VSVPIGRVSVRGGLSPRRRQGGAGAGHPHLAAGYLDDVVEVGEVGVAVRSRSCSRFSVEEVQGRLDESLTYPGGLTVHPIVLRSPLGRQRNVAEYQIRQTRRGVEVHVRLVGEVDLAAWRAEIAGELARVGMNNPKVVFTPVDHLARQANGKVKRIVPLRAHSKQPVAPTPGGPGSGP
jgi:phenylacetate-coenzyme A ligase PaaK-like adenylate-forming protein